MISALAVFSAYALGCEDEGGGLAGGVTEGDGGANIPPDAAIGPGDAEAPATTMRLAHVASDLGAVDFCYRTASTTAFQGPVLGGGRGGPERDAGGGAGDGGDAAAAAADAAPSGDGDAGDAGAESAASVRYRTVSRYLRLKASGPLTIALVAPGATSCATPLFEADVTLDPGKLTTVAILGRRDTDAGSASLALIAYIDDRMTVPIMARVRMIHAALGTTRGRGAAGALAVRAASSDAITVADRVEPKGAAQPSASVPVDSLGYATIPPVPSPAQLAVGAAAASTGTSGGADASVDSWLSASGDLGLRGGSLHTGFVLSADEQPFEVLWCTDTSTSGDRTTCDVVR